MPDPAATLDQAVAIEHRMNGAFGRDGNTGKSADQAFADFSRTPAGVLVLHIQNKVFHLERKLVGVAVPTAAPVCEPLNAAFLIAIEDLVAGLARKAELPAEFRQRLAGSNKNLLFQGNRYTACQASNATWTFDNHTYDVFDEYGAATGQEQGSSWKADMSAPPCLGEGRSRPKGHSGITRSRTNHRAARGSAAATWAVVSELPASFGPDGLLEAASDGQIAILKNLSRQFRPSGLSTSVRLDLKGPLREESEENVILDYATNGFDVFQSPHK